MEQPFGEDKLLIPNAPHGYLSKFRAYNNAVQALAVSPAWTVVQFPTENFDILGEFNDATGIFTVSQTGYYLLIANLGSNLAAGRSFIAVLWRVGLGAICEIDHHNGDAALPRQHGGCLTMIYYLTAGQQIRVQAQALVGASLNGGTSACSFSAHRLS